MKDLSLEMSILKVASKAVKEAEKELAEEVRSSMLGRKKKTTQKDTDDDIEFIDL